MKQTDCFRNAGTYMCETGCMNEETSNREMEGERVIGY